MRKPHYRYFIELQPRDGTHASRAFEAEAQRQAASGFIETMREWLREKDLADKVSALGVTMFGQIQITCEATVIKLIRNQDVVDIAAIRQGVAYTENLGRWNDAR
jgi:hypothetical protein